MRLEIVFEDADVIVVRKPAGLATQSAAVDAPDAVSELKRYLAGKERKPVPYLGVIHRLDQPVEGLLVFAKTGKAAAELSGQLSKGVLNKKYVAAVLGVPAEPEGELLDHLRKEGNVTRVVTGREGEFQDAKEARLSYRMLAGAGEAGLVGDGGEMVYSLLETEIETGRFHQIRAQLSHAGYPILGDEKYGNEASKGLARRLGIRTVALCANELTFVQPRTKKKVTFKCRPSWAALFENNANGKDLF